MTSPQFVHLNFHTGYSLLDSTCKVEDSLQAVADLGMPALAMTDNGVLYGAVEFYKTAQKAGVKPILGCQMYMAPEGTTMRERKTGQNGSHSNHLLLLAETDQGYRNLMRLVSLSHLEGFYYKPRIDLELLARHAEGLIGLSAGRKGIVPEHVRRDDLPGAVRHAEALKEIFGPGNFFLELQNHGGEEDAALVRGLAEVAAKTGLPLVATNSVRYLKREHAEAHDVLICLQGQTVFSDPHRMRYGSDQFYLKSPREMAALFQDHPEAIANTLRIAERCNVTLSLGKELHFPLYVVPEGYTQKAYLIHLGKEGIRQRYGVEDIDHPRDDREKIIADRFYFELGVIEITGFVNYFLVVWDFIRFAHNQQIPVGPGRGSGAGSLVAYSLGITGIDPLRYNLIFERFLNPDRVSPPDFDIDFCQSRRGEVIEYVKEKYGRDAVAQIITFGTLGAKTVIRDIGRVLEIPFSECDRLAKLVPEDPGMTLDKALDVNPDFKAACATDDYARQIMKYAPVLEGLPRNPGTHAAGVVIGEKPLIEIIPLARDKDKEVVTQFEMKPVEQVGLLKMDFLGLKTLTVIQETVDSIRENHGLDLDVDGLPVDDERTFALLNRGDTIGVFQVESAGMQDLLRRMGLNSLEDLIALIALYRPGPMNMLDDFISRKHKPETIKYDHPLLEPILRETYGVMLYQEQVQRAAAALAGFTLAQGDLLRRAMGKKNPAEMAAQQSQFIEGCLKNKIPREKAQAIFSNIERFAGYGFNKSHSAAYAIISWRTAYLKAHYPAEFMAALLSSEMGNTDKLPGLIAEAQRMNLPVLPPSVNESGVRFRAIGGGIRFGLAGVKNVGEGAVSALVQERNANGPYRGLVDFCTRQDAQVVNRKMLESLVKCGAFDFTGASRGQLFGAVEFAMSRAAEIARDKASGQGSLFDMLAPGPAAAPSAADELPPGEPWPLSEMLRGEKELLGFYISGHPLKEFQWMLDRYSLTSVADLASLPLRQPTRVGGLVTQFQKKFTRKNQEAMGVFRLEGEEGSIEVVAFPEAFREFGVFLKEDEPVMVCGEFTREDRQNLSVLEIYPLAEVHNHFTRHVSIHIPTGSVGGRTLQDIRAVLHGHPGKTPVVLCLIFPEGEKIFIRPERQFSVTVSEKLHRQLEQITGENTVYVDVARNVVKRERQSKWGNRNGRG